MRKHVPLKATIRQPIRTLIFVLLVGLASFGFVSRAVEYIILSREMNRIEQFYRTTGTLVPMYPITDNNVYNIAEILSGSPYVAFEDRRAIVQGVMSDGILNVMRGQHTIGGHQLMRGEQALSFMDLYIFDTIMIVEVDSLRTRTVMLPDVEGFTEVKSLRVRIDEALHGHNPFAPTRNYQMEFYFDENGNTLVDHIREGDFLLARAVQPDIEARSTTIDFFPLFDDVLFVNAHDEAAMAYAFERMADEIAILDANSSMLMITGTRDMTALPLVQSGAYTRFQGRFINYQDYLDANHVIVIPQRIDSARPAARVGETITLTLRDMRTFRDGMPPPPQDHPMWDSIPPGAETFWRNMPAGYWVSIPNNYPGDWQNYPTVTIEVEVIGSYRVPDSMFLPRWAHIEDIFQTMEAFVPASIIPEGFGIVDAHIVSGAYSFVLSSPDAEDDFRRAHGEMLADAGYLVQFAGEDPTNFLLSAVPIRNSIFINLLLFSAVLVLVLALTVFLFLRQRYKEFAIMRALGVTQGNAVWQVAVPVLLFWIPVTIGAGIGAWFFALNQAAASLQILAEVGIQTDYAQPFVVMNILERMRFEAAQLEDFVTPELDIIYLVWLCIGIAAAWLCAVIIGTLAFAAKSMLALIQGVNSGGVPRRIKETTPPASFKLASIGEILLVAPARRFGGKIASVLRHHRRHVLRAPVKSILVVCMALLFIISLGWLDRTISFTEQEIERLYSTTTITGQIINPVAGVGNVMWGHEVPFESIERLIVSGHIADVNATALFSLGLLPSFDHSHDYGGTLHELHHVGMLNDFIKTISCWETFLHEVNQPVVFGLGHTGEFTIEFIPDFDPYEFAQGWDLDWIIENAAPDVLDENRFINHSAITEEDDDDDQEPEEDFEAWDMEAWRMPIIVHESLLHRYHMLDLGEDPTHFFAATGIVHTSNHISRHAIDENGNMIPQMLSLGDEVYLAAPHMRDPMRAVIVGVYSGGHPSVTYRMGQGLILTTTRFTNFSSVNFTLQQESIRNLHNIADELNALLSYSIHHQWFNEQSGNYQHWSNNFLHLIELNDHEFRTVVVPLEESLHLLRILYPIAIAMSFVLALGLSLLLMLQNAKNVAILRVLGSPRYKTRFNLSLEQLAVNAVGLAIGFAIVLVLGIGLQTAAVLVGMYLTGAVIGTVVGCLVISYKTPLELLQVRE